MSPSKLSPSDSHDHKPLRIYKASAGSGKTFTLTGQYLQLLLGEQNPDTGSWALRPQGHRAHRNILAITFTNKATGEMTSRIIRDLAILAGREPGQKDHGKYMQTFCQCFKATPQEIAALASATLDDMLADFAYFHVSTIDAFFQSVLRTFAREVDMPDNFDLELDDEGMIRMGVNDMFQSLNRRAAISPEEKQQQKWLTGWLRDYMERQFTKGNAINILSRTSQSFTSLVKSLSNLCDEDYRLHAPRLRSYMDNPTRFEAFRKQLRDHLSALLEDVVTKAQSLLEHPVFEGKNINHHLKNKIAKLAEGDMGKEPGDTLSNARDTPDCRFTAAYLRMGPDSRLSLRIENFCEDALNLYEYKALIGILERTADTFGLLGSVLRHVDEYCRENNTMLLSSTTTLLRRIINNDDAPFVYERLGYYLQHYLIDEFQDTSRMQWENLQPLVSESLSNKRRNLLIGDVKQSIYRFRNADPTLLGHEVAKHFTKVFEEDYVEVEGEFIEQNSNWRSSEEVVRFNNTVFTRIALAENLHDIYNGVVQQIDPGCNRHHGYVKLVVEPQRDKATKRITDIPDSGNDMPDMEQMSFALPIMVKEVDRMLRAGYRRKDIVVLVRTHRHGAEVIEALLSPERFCPDWSHGRLEVTSADTMPVSASSAVRIVVEALRLALAPEKVVNTRSGDGSPEEELNLKYRQARLLFHYEHILNTSPGLGESGALAQAVALLADEDAEKSDAGYDVSPARLMKGRSGTALTLSSLVEILFSKYVPQQVREADTIFIEAFRDMVYDFSLRSGSDIRAFLQWWDTEGKSKRLTSVPESDALCVMTIHQSKGLEFPCVIIPYANWPFTSSETAWLRLTAEMFPFMPAELVPERYPVEVNTSTADVKLLRPQALSVLVQQRIDSLNLAYVAFTRAKSELVVIVPHNKGNDNLYCSLRDISAMPDFMEGAPQDSRKAEWLCHIPVPDETGTIAIGSPTKPSTTTDDAATAGMPMPPYVESTNPSLVTLALSKNSPVDMADPRLRGDFLHEVMSGVDYRRSLPGVLHRHAYAAHLTEQEEKECLKVLEQALDDPRVRQWFEGFKRLANERPLVAANETLTRRPDRIVWTADGHIDIIDYKFGDLDRRYFSQVRRYMRMMLKAGYRNVRGFLWQPLSAVVTPVPLQSRD